MIRTASVFEVHLTVSDLSRAMDFYGRSLAFEVAHVVPERQVAFYWVGGRGRSMLGVWSIGSSPQKMSLHTAFGVELQDLLDSPTRLREAGITPLDFSGQPTNEPIVLAWMPAGSIYFRDPDGNHLEFITMLQDEPRPELGVVTWTEWKAQSRQRKKPL